MKSDWQNDLFKVVMGGCGTQLGLFFTCGVFAVGLVIFLACGLTSLLSVTFTNYSWQQTVRAAPTAEMTAGNAAEAGDTMVQTSIQPLPAAAGLSEPVTTLPETGNSPLLSSVPSPIVTATQGRVNLRLGPGTEYPSAALLPNKASLPIVGRNADSSWWLVSTSIGLVWVYDGVISTVNLNPEIPIVDFATPPGEIGTSISVQAAQPAVNSASSVGESAGPAAPAPPPVPVGTPTPDAGVQRIFAEQTVGWKRLREQLAAPPISESFSPNGDPIAVTEGVKLHLVAGDGSYYKMLLDSNEVFRIIGGVVWSPDGEYLAFMVDYKAKKCRPCRSVGLVRMADESIFFLQTPDNLDSEAPRWTQDGRLVINVHPSEPASGETYIYDVTGRGQKASGLLVLSTSHEGQKWYPWQPGRSWRAGISERPDTYYD